MLRREFMSGFLGLPFAACVADRRVKNFRGPQFWIASRGEARVFIFGFGEAKDKSWFTPPIQKAFQESSQLWLENPGPGSSDDQDPAAKKAAAERMEKLGHESGRSFFDVLTPSVRERTLAYMAELGIAKESVETLRPWRAYYVIVSAFWSKRKLSFEPVYVDAVLEEMAKSAGKRIGYETPTREALISFLASMSDRAQSQYIEWLLDFLDDSKKGLDEDAETFGWIEGHHFPMRSLDRMRKKPDLYQVMQMQRNQWWARKIEELLAAKETCFVGIGQLHVLGPDGIPRQLERLGVAVEEVMASGFGVSS